MPTHRVTPAASEVIQRGKAAGKSSRELADLLREQLGIELDQRSISRHILRLSEKPGKKREKRPPTPQAPPPRRGRTTTPPETPDERVRLDLNGGVASVAPTLNETAALEREVIRIQNLLATDIPNRDRVALVAEMRQSLRSIRQANAAATKGKTADDREVADMKAKLKRFALRNVKDFGEAETDAVPEVGRAEGSG